MSNKKLNGIKNWHPYLLIKESDRGGRGVFAKKDIPKGLMFLQDPTIFVTYNDAQNYIYEDKNKIFLSLGYGSLINHSNKKSNCYWTFNLKKQFINFYALCDIAANSEILHNYEWPEYPDNFLE